MTDEHGEKDSLPEVAREVLRRCLEQPGYTPPLKHAAALLLALADLDEDAALRVERALVSIGPLAVLPALRVLEQAPVGRRIGPLKLLARLVSPQVSDKVLSTLSQTLASSEGRELRLAARGIAKLADPQAEPALLDRLETASGADAKALVDALALVGGSRASEVLTRDRLVAGADADLERRLRRAQLLIARREQRGQPGGLALEVSLARPALVSLRFRRGLGDAVRRQWQGVTTLLPFVRSEPVWAPTAVRFLYQGSLGGLLEVRSALQVSLCVPLPDGPAPLLERAAASMASSATLSVLKAYTHGAPRFRIKWKESGRRRADVWQLASAIEALSSELVNDSQGAHWTAEVPTSAAHREIEWVPRLEPDPRFSYRRADVAAASHPTIAAALATLAEPRSDDVIWDPFVGSGLELIECSRLAKGARLWGTDTDARALESARQNLAAAEVDRVTLVHTDAREFRGARPSLIVSNPPMGRRVARDGSVSQLLAAVTAHAASLLAPGGRILWLSPVPAITAQVARLAGLDVELGQNVDLGGFEAQLQTYRRLPR